MTHFKNRVFTNKTVLSIFLLLISPCCQHKTLNNEAFNFSYQIPTEVEHTVIIYLENHSFHNLFAKFPGVDNQSRPEYTGQVDQNGLLFETLPPIKGRHDKEPDHRFKGVLTNAPFPLDPHVKLSEKVPDPTHEFFTHQAQINGGLNNKFVAYSAVGGLPMGTFDLRSTFLWRLATEYTLSDHFFPSSFGGSFINHQFLIAGRAPYYEKAPESLLMKLGKNMVPEKSAPLTPDGFAVNSIQPFAFPYDEQEIKKQGQLPAQIHNTIGDLLSEKNISWAWYAGGWKERLAGDQHASIQIHHQPFVYFEKYGPNTEGRRAHLKDESDLFMDIKKQHLPAVSFFKPFGFENGHPGYSEVASADGKLKKIVEAIQNSPYWKKTLIIITFDEHGGFWDPIAPPVIDRWGLGTRIPAIFVSQFVKKKHIDHTQYETTSILAYLEKKYNLKALSERDKKANPLSGIWE